MHRYTRWTSIPAYTRRVTDALREGFELGGYRIEATTGSHATGTVYRAADMRTGATVALHMIATRLANLPHFRERFHRDLGVLTDLSHPGLLGIFATGEQSGADEYDSVRLWSAQQPAPGPDLVEMTRRRGKLAPVEASKLVAQAAEALDAAHERGVLHRGLEPGSVLVHDDEAFLAGFGVVDDGAVEGGTGDIHRSAYPPSPDYVAPEQIAGKPVDRRADVYAMGAILYFAITGRPPFEGESIEAILNGHLRGKPPVPTHVVSGVPETLNGVVARALAKNPDERYATAAELAEDILRRSGASRSRSRGVAAAVPASPEAAPAVAATEPVPIPDKQRVIEAWTEAVSEGGRLWSPSAAGRGVPSASSAAARPPDELSVPAQGDFSAFESARRRAVPDAEPETELAAKPVERPSAVAETPAPDKRTPRPVEVPPPKARRGGASRPSRNVLVALGVAVAIALLAGLGLALARGGDDTPDSAAAPDTPAPRPKPEPAPEQPSATPATPKPKPALISWPAREAYTAVVFAGTGSRAEATARANDAVRQGVKAGVLRSDDFKSLQPGYWVAFAGVHQNRAQAQKTADRMRTSDVAGNPYVRFIGQQER